MYLGSCLGIRQAMALIGKAMGKSGPVDTRLTGVTGYFAPQEIWHPHSIFPRKIGTPLGNQAPPIMVVFYASLHAYYPRISCTSCPLS